jgi:hypothetical protein
MVMSQVELARASPCKGFCCGTYYCKLKTNVLSNLLELATVNV